MLTFATLVPLGACSSDPSNQPPELGTPTAITDEDVPVDLKVLESAHDPEGDPLVVTLASAPDHRVDVIDATTIRLTSKPDYNGAIIVTYHVSDGSNDTTGRVVVAVRPINDAPIAGGGAQSVNGPADIVLAATDVDGDALTYEILTPPAHGTLTGTPPRLHYAPALDFSGQDAFTYRALDRSLASPPATFQLAVGIGLAPTAFPANLFVAEDHAIGVHLVGRDPQGEPLAYTIVTRPRNGTLTGTPPDLVYTPAANFSGTDALVFSVNNGTATSANATVAITVTPLDDAPVATPQTVAVTEDTSRAITLAATDVENDPLSFLVVTEPAHGTLSGSGAALIYTPAANYHGMDSFAFTASDGQLTSAAVAVTIAVTSVEDPPIAAAFSQVLSEDVPAAVVLRGSDGDGDPITYALATPPVHGTLSGTAPALTYAPDANYHGPDSFTYTVSSGGTTTDPATVTLEITAVNDPPVAVNATVTTAEDTPVDITLQASDVDGDPLTFSIGARPADGTLTGSGANLTYTPAPNATGTRSFTFFATDGVASATATITIEITPVNDPPTTHDDYVATDPETPLTFDVVGNDIDIEGDAFTLDAADPPAHGTARVVAGKILYTPAAGFTGIDLVTYTVTDAHGASSTGTAHVGVGTFPPGAPGETLATVGGPVTDFDLQRAPAISNDGRFVAFTSALPLVGDDANGVDDVYVFDRGTHVLTRISVASDGGEGNGPSLRPQLSADGRHVVFESSATNLVTGDTNGVTDVFRHDRVTGETIRVSVTAAGGEADLASQQPAISGDGRYVAFLSAATNLVAGDTNNVNDIFVHDRIAGTTTRVSVSSTGGEANNLSFGPSISRDGRFISFLSSATNLVVGGSGTRLYVRDTQALTTTRPTPGSSALWARLSGDGRYVTAFFGSGVTLIDRFAATSVSLPGSSNLFWPAISGNGRYVVALDQTSGGRITVLPNPL